LSITKRTAVYSIVTVCQQKDNEEGDNHYVFRNITKAGDKVPPDTVFSPEDESRLLSKHCECFCSEIMENFLCTLMMFHMLNRFKKLFGTDS
jgi:hypothetical protein